MSGSLAFMFPGQGSQKPGMLSALNEEYPLIKQTVDESSEYFKLDLWSLMQSGSKQELGLTEITQPVMFAAGVAVWRLWCTLSDARPHLLSGHSLGEFTAYVCGGALTLADGAALVKRRSELMRDACPDGIGSMAAVLGMKDPQVESLCEEAAQGQVVQAVNFNAPGQIVIAGHREAVERAAVLAKSQQAKVMALPISVPCHSDLMRPAAESLARLINDTQVKLPQIPVINNLEAGIETDPQRIRVSLIKQLYSPVQWVRSIATMQAYNIDTVIECGPGKVLCGMAKRIAPDLRQLSIQDPAGLAEALELYRQQQKTEIKHGES